MFTCGDLNIYIERSIQRDRYREVCASKTNEK